MKQQHAPVKPGDKLIIDRWDDMPVTVVDVSFQTKSDRWLVIVEWPHGHGMSRVWGDDEGNGWKRSGPPVNQTTLLS